MYLFSRSARLAPGRTRDAMAWAVGITEKVNQIGELSFSLWTPVLSPGIGMLSWSAFVEELDELEATEAKLLVDDGYVAELDRGAAFSDGQGANDSLLQLIHGEVDPERRFDYVSVTASQLAPGHFAKGVEVGIEICQRVEQITSTPTAFCMASTGPYGGVAWIAGQESLKALQDGEQAINADPGFLELVDGTASQAFQVAATTATIYRRIV
jgi:hypothetical protein